MSEAQKGRASRILVVDDEMVVREVVRSVLDRPGYFLVDAADGEEAISLLLKEPFDLLIADKNLPGITGLDVIRRAKAADRNMATLLITAYASRESAEEALAIGVDDYIVKPFELNDLEQKVAEVLERRLKRLQMKRQETRARPNKLRVLVCEPDGPTCQHVVDGVRLLGHTPSVVTRVADILESLRQKEVDAAIVDLEIMDRDNAASCFLRSTLLVFPDVPLVAVVKERGFEGAVGAIHHGARKVLYQPLLTDAHSVADALESVLGRLQK